MVITFKASESISPTVFTRDSFVNPCWIAKKISIFLIKRIQGYERVKVVEMWKDRGIYSQMLVDKQLGERRWTYSARLEDLLHFFVGTLVSIHLE
jgi:hypothetical protein